MANPFDAFGQYESDGQEKSDWFTSSQLIVAALTDVKYRKRSTWLRLNCPLCEDIVGTPDQNQAMGVHTGHGGYRCWRCGSSGRIAQEAFESIGIELDLAHQQSQEEHEKWGVEPPENFTLLSDESTLENPLFDCAYEFLAKRGVTSAEVEDLSIGACWGGQFSGRIVIPLFAADGTWLWFSARKWFKKTQKPYMYPKGYRGPLLYNHAALFRRVDIPVFVVEGCFDAIALSPDSVAVLGKPTPEHLLALEASRRPVVFVLDGDAHEEGWALAQTLNLRGIRSGSIRLPPKVDPDELDLSLLREGAQVALDRGEYRIA